MYLTDRLDELVVSEVALRRRARTGILDAGDGRTGIREDWPANADMAPLPERWWWEPCGAADERAPPAGAPKSASTPRASSSVPSKVGMPKPGDVTSWPLTTSPKNGCRPVDAGRLADRVVGVTSFFRVGDVWWSRLLRLPVVRLAAAFRGVEGAGWGRSLGFRLLNLYDP